MGIKQFKVEFDNNNRCFFPNQIVSGNVVLELKKKKDIKGLWIIFDGKATVSWTESYLATDRRCEANKSRKIVYRDIEPYFNVILNLAGNSDLNSDSIETDLTITIPAGKTVFPFAFTLPPGIPSSYTGKSGQVYYTAETILRSGKSNQTQRVPFTVNGILDLNFNPRSTEKMDIRRYKSVGCCCCRSGPVGFLVKLPKKGYVPGEQIKFAAEITNNGKRRVKGITLSLIQTVSFHAKGNTFTDIRTIRKIRGPDVDPGEVEVWSKDSIQIPPIPPTKLATCGIIDVHYTLKVEMEMAEILTASLAGEMGIIIGTIPLRAAFPLLRAPPRPPAPAESILGILASSRFDTVPAPPSDPTAPPFLESYPDLPPPTYEEAMNVDTTTSARGQVNASFKTGHSDGIGDTEMDEVFRLDETFRPQYVTYNWVG